MKISSNNRNTNLSNLSFDKSLPKKITIEDLINTRDIYHKALNTKKIKKERIDTLKNEYFSMRDCFIEQNKAIVPITINRMNLFPQNERLRDDIFQQGFLALIRAINYYSLNGTATFQTYAISAIKHSIKRFLSEITYPFQIPHNSFSTASILADRGRAHV